MGHRNKINNKGAGKWLIKKKVVFADYLIISFGKLFAL